MDMVILDEIAEETKDRDFEKLSLEDMGNEEVLSTSAIEDEAVILHVTTTYTVSASEECKLFIELRINNDACIKKFTRHDMEEFFQLVSTCKKA